MQRRNFIKTGGLTALALSALSVSSCHVLAPSSTRGANDQPTTDNFELNELSVFELQKKMENKTYTSKSITALYLQRIAKIDQAGPQLHAVIELHPSALQTAEEMDKERAAGKVRGPLHGIPVLIKDNIDTGDGLLTSAGSLALSDNYQTEDAFIIKRLREAGAVIIGKTNLSEWANFRSSRSTSAWSSRGGQTKNPYVLDRNPSGSSSGSGSAVAANLCALAIGTETDGSIISPSSVNNLVGIKPTVGLWSRTGIIPISKTQDTAGPMTRSVTDAAILLGALTGVDDQDPVTKYSEGRFKKDYTTFLRPDGLKGKRLGVEKSAFKRHAATDELLNEAIRVLRSQGAIVTEISLNDTLKNAGDAEFTVLLYEFKAGLNAYLSGCNSKIKSLADVIAYNKVNEATMMPFFKQETLEKAQIKGDLTEKEYLEALEKSHVHSKKAIDRILTDHNLDAIIAPSNGFPVCIDLVNGDYDNGFYFSSAAAMAGYSHITVPMGSWHDLPMGLSFIGTAYAEPALLLVAFAYEQASNKRTSPQFKPVVV
ncbi:amidase [Pedobacter sp. CAN_A7]|uniref:amidase n=1 Tax=Pedobacter sp. CAN_A7 TaxID=2787722 RepID=UPI0018CAEE1C